MSHTTVRNGNSTTAARSGGSKSTLHFNVRRAASDGQRVQSRASALEQKEKEYEEKLAKHKEKELQKEIKKREQYLAKYKHVDQGRKLSEGYLNEASGFTPVVYESQEEIRKRQQNELMQKALIHQQIQRQIEEKKEAEKITKKLEKCKHINIGYKLGDIPKQPQGLQVLEGKKESKTSESVDTKNASETYVNADSQFTNELNLKVQVPIKSQQSPLKQLSHEVEAIQRFEPAKKVVKPTHQGPVLVLRKTTDELNRALAKRKEVDEMDKLGFSSSYKVTVEKNEYIHNGFEIDIGIKPNQETTHTEPKNSNPGVSRMGLAAEEPIDHLAEMRAARLKMQQKYEEALRQQQSSQD